MKPAEALLDRVTTCAAEPVARSAFTPSATALPEAIQTTACASLPVIAGTMVLKSGLPRSALITATGWKPAFLKPLLAPSRPSMPKESSACTTAMRAMPSVCRCGHGLLGLALVGGAHVEHVLAHRLVQHHRAGGRRHQGHPFASSSGMMPSEWGVPRLRNRARTFFSSISTLALALASGGSNLSSIGTSSIFWPWIPPLALTLSSHSLAPSVVSFTPAATGAAEAGRLADEDLRQRPGRRQRRDGGNDVLLHHPSPLALAGLCAAE